MISNIRPTVGRKRINAEGEAFVARFAEGTGERIKSALRPGEKRAEFVRVAVENELERRQGG